MQNKIYATEICNLIKKNFNNAEITCGSVSETMYTIVNSDAPFIRVGSRDEWQDFKSWDEASAYANGRTDNFMVGIRPYRKSGAMALATIKNV